jgi:ectoine hydroxylase-related dioxygenase (phytanoyl-CoA dioxygenase family)
VWWRPSAETPRFGLFCCRASARSKSLSDGITAAVNNAADLDRAAADLERDGICVLPGLLPEQTVAAWADAFRELFERRSQVEGGLAPRGTARSYLTLPWVPPFADPQVFAHPAILGVLDRVFAQEYVLVQLGADVAGPGAEAQEIHRDYRPLFDDDVVTPLYALAVNFPLVEVTEANGPFKMARGTHVLTREEGLRRIESGDNPIESFLAQPGDVTIRTPLALHQGSPNVSDGPRPMVVLGYVMHWLHTPEVGLDVPRDFYDSLAPEAQRLLRARVVDELPEAGETYVKFAF